MNNNNNHSTSVHDYRTKFRAFIIIYHPTNGYLLLKGYKKSKGLHHQLVGGRIDNDEIRQNGMLSASKIAAIRECYEETGLRIKDHHRLIHLNFNIKNRVYYSLNITDEDSLIKLYEHDNDNDNDNNDNDKKISNYTKSDTNEDFYIKISKEHCGFCFEKDIKTAMNMIELHSGGHNKNALKKYGKLKGILKSRSQLIREKEEYHRKLSLNSSKSSNHNNNHPYNYNNIPKSKKKTITKYDIKKK